MSARVCRWGILGAANIARKNWQAIRKASNCTLVAVASRDLQRCRQFIESCQADVPHPVLPRAVDSYEQLLAADDIDAVYLPLPTTARKAWAIRAAEAGKHVLSEKPVGATAGDVREIVEACRHNGVQFTDGVMFLHSQRLERMRHVLDDGRSVGRIRRIATQFSFRGDSAFFENDIRLNSRLEPLGCLGDLGWYNIGFVLWAMKYQLPSTVTGQVLSAHQGQDSPAEVPTEFSGELRYEGGVSASFYCSFLTENQQWASVTGTHGHLYVRDFVLPFFGSETAFEVSQPEFEVTGCDFNMKDRTQRIAVSEYSNSAENAQETRLFDHFAHSVLSGTPDTRWGEITLHTQTVLDACLQSARAGGQAVYLAAG
jgi:predicted dehydrogenase